MNHIIIAFKEDPLRITVAGGRVEIGTQFDNCSSKFIFKRPQEFCSDSLVLYFNDGNKDFLPISIGVENEFVITSYLTQTTVLKMQIAFERNELIVCRSNVYGMFLRSSLLEGGATANFLPESMPRLVEEALTKVEYKDNKLIFHNFANETVETVCLPSYSPYVGHNGNWHE